MKTTDATRATAEALPEEPSLFRLIANYWDQYDILVSAMKATDMTMDGTPEREAADQFQCEAGESVAEAAINVCGYLPTWSWEAKVKSHFLNCLADANAGNLTQDETRALLLAQPLLTVAARKGGAA